MEEEEEEQEEQEVCGKAQYWRGGGGPDSQHCSQYCEDKKTDSNPKGKLNTIMTC